MHLLRHTTGQKHNAQPQNQLSMALVGNMSGERQRSRQTIILFAVGQCRPYIRQAKIELRYPVRLKNEQP